MDSLMALPNPMCEILHPGQSCVGHYCDFYMRHMLGFSLRFYLPLNVVSTLIFNRKPRPYVKSGTFVSDQGFKISAQTPRKVNASTFVFGGKDPADGLFKMISVDARGKCLECRHTQRADLLDIKALTVTQWDAAHRGGEYTVTDIATAQSGLMGDPRGTILRVSKSVFRSASFLSLYCANAWGMQCLSRRAGLLSAANLPLFMAVSAGPSILLEDKGRRLELAMYCLSPTLQAVYNLARDAGLFQRHLAEFHVLQIFGFAMGVIMTAHEMDMSHLQPTFEQILKNLLGLN